MTPTTSKWLQIVGGVLLFIGIVSLAAYTAPRPEPMAPAPKPNGIYCLFGDKDYKGVAEWSRTVSGNYYYNFKALNGNYFRAQADDLERC